ncbi:MAG: hypothetical protein N2170_05325 [Bacteroidia bacterium]|nr:hypothetical protein [Bacteroidia bacterium]
MERLRPGWFLEGLWDAEYQQYRLLAYLQTAQRAFLAQRLYPPLGDLIASYAEMNRLAEEVKGPWEEPSPELSTLEEIITFALPRLQAAIEEGKTLYELIAQLLQVHVVGVVPLYRDEGYLLLRRGAESTVRVYRYELRHLYDSEGQHVAIRLVFLGEYAFSLLALGFGRIRERLLRENPDLPVPLTLAVESPWVLPVEETLLPIIQRSLPKWTQEAATGGIG